MITDRDYLKGILLPNIIISMTTDNGSVHIAYTLPHYRQEFASELLADFLGHLVTHKVIKDFTLTKM